MASEKKKQGFATFDEETHKKVSSKGGSKKNSKKGFGSMSKEKLREMSSEAGKKRWARVKAEREAEEAQHEQ